MIVFKPRPIKNIPDVNCTDLEVIMGRIKMGPSASKLSDLQSELNKLFKMSYCESVIYTKNTDKPFFGMCVMPTLTQVDFNRVFLNNEPSDMATKKYFLELDSKLFDIDLNNKELTAILLHELGHVAFEIERAMEEVSKAMCLYLQKNNDTVDIKKSIEFKDLLIFGVKDALRKINSIFEDEEISADSYTVALGYGDYLKSALEKITRNISTLNKSVTNNKLLILQWTLRAYKDIKFKRIPAIDKLEKCLDLTGSKLERQEIQKCINSIKSVESKRISESTLDMMVQEAKNSISIFRTFKRKNMRKIEDDLYEYALRVKSVDEQDEALRILRDINTRLSIVDDYLNEDLDSKERERWNHVRKRYMELRDTLSKKTTYDDKYYGLFVKTPVIKSRYEI